METYPKIAITFNNTKEAALYFDYVVPFGSNFEWIVDSLIRNRGETHCKRPQDITLPPILRENNSFSLDLYRVTQMHSSFMMGHHWKVQNGINDQEKFNQDAVLLYREIQKIIQKYNLTNIPIICSKHDLMAEYSKYVEKYNLILSLPPFGMINTQNVSWEKIEEFRKDSKSIVKLRRLRLFIYENYQKRSKSYIEDDILNRIYEYEETAKRWGFETKQEILSMIFSSKVLGGAVSGYLISTLLGADIQAIWTVIGGVSIEIGRIGVMLHKRKYCLADILEDNPISYIATAKEKFESK